ncbi:MAG TPA: thiamine pyrophosphate-dependent dehydrogenase E1 component subunit alpha [Candidatus Binatia bacterium]|nr:thiamine pyrophosphate-dependent dehydrogenase E1 component subunit alpha [Candidatus Binatia bacterium]
MLLIRHFEERLIALHNSGDFRGHYHVYIGQEATGVPALACLDAGDYVFTTHRNHGHLLARGADPRRIFAEILGRRDGYNKGKGGSFHVAAADLGFLQTSGVVAGILPLATGTAYAAKALKNGRVTLCCFGDGALEEGAAPEALNLASLWKLPLLFLCENNGKYGAGRATAAAQSESMAAYPLTDLPRAYKIPAREIDGTDAGAVYAAVSEAIEAIRRGGGPRFIESQTVRWPGSETNWPTIPAPTSIALAWDASTVPEKAREWYRASDPVLIYLRELVERRVATRDELVDLETEAKKIADAAARFALASPYPDPEEALKDVFA